MRPWQVWLIAVAVSLTTVLVCSAIGVAGVVVFRHQIGALLTPPPSAAPGAAHANPALASAPSPEPSIAPSASVEPDPTVVAHDRTILFEDDFSDPESGWYDEQEGDDLGVMGYSEDGYRVLVTEPEAYLWSMHRSIKFARLDDVRIDVGAAQTDGYVDSSFGVICRARGDRYYTFEISTDGWYGIGKADGDDFEMLTEVGETQSIAHVASDGYHIRADCIGNTLTLYLNSRKIATAHDDSFRTGGVGVIVSNYESPRTEVIFDNIVVSTP